MTTRPQQHAQIPYGVEAPASARKHPKAGSRRIDIDVPKGSNVVPFWVVDYHPYKITKKDLHSSLWVDVGTRDLPLKARRSARGLGV